MIDNYGFIYDSVTSIRIDVVIEINRLWEPCYITPLEVRVYDRHYIHMSAKVGTAEIVDPAVVVFGPGPLGLVQPLQ